MTVFAYLVQASKNPLTLCLVTSILTATAIYSAQSIIKAVRIYYIKQELRADLAAIQMENVNGKDTEELVQEQLSRNIAFLGLAGVNKLRDSFVVIVGLGGVGSHAAHMLVRAGVSHIRLIDFDQVTLSSLNRHAVATRADVGIPKVVAMKNHLLQTCPDCRIEAIDQMFKGENAGILIGSPDYVLDCIDHLQTKIELIEFCVINNIKIISSMGAGAKADPSRIQIADISDTFEDPLARSVRQTLHRKSIKGAVPVVFSTEKPSIKLAPLDESQVADADQYAALPSFRSRILPVLGTIPALFGNAMASFVITEISGFPIDPIGIKATKRAAKVLYSDLVSIERKIKGPDIDDIAFIYEETWRCKSAFGGNVGDKLTMLRWDPKKPATFGNIVCLTKAQAILHQKLNDCAGFTYSKEQLAFVASRFAKESQSNAWR